MAMQTSLLRIKTWQGVAACWRGPAHWRLGLQAALDQLHGAGQQADGHAGARARKELVAYGELRACI